MAKAEESANKNAEDEVRAAEAEAELRRINNVFIEDIRVRGDQEAKARKMALENDRLRAEVMKRINEAEKARNDKPVSDVPTAIIT